MVEKLHEYRVHEYEDGRRLRITHHTVAAPSLHREGSSPSTSGGFDSVWSAYDQLGPAEYYARHGESYRNPHEPVISIALGLALDAWEALLGPLHRVLDLACGSGEASLAFSRWHSARSDPTAGSALELMAADPFTAAAYESRVGRAAHTWSFEEIAEGLWNRQGVAPWDVVMCSYALHLLGAQPLHQTLRAVAEHSRLLIVATPHKRPRDVDVCRAGWRQAGALSFEGLQVRLYRSQHIAPGAELSAPAAPPLPKRKRGVG